MPVMPSNPAASAARARSTSWSNESRICGRNRLNSMAGILPYLPMSDWTAAETSSLASAATRNPAARADLVARTQAVTNVRWSG